MDSLLSQPQEKLLQFVDACNSSGYKPSPDRVQQWLDSPEPRLGRSTLTQSLLVAFSSLNAWSTVPGTAETDVEHALRLGWVYGDQALGLTDLGRALLVAARRESVEAATVETVTLDRDDPLSYPRLMGQVAAAGAGMLVDPYLRVEQVHDIVGQSSITRLLMSKQRKGSGEIRSAISTYLAGVSGSRGIEVRASSDDELHDRFILTESGEVSVLGASLNGISAGTVSTLIIPLPSAASQAQASKLEEWWDAAEVVTPATAPPSVDPPPT